MLSHCYVGHWRCRAWFIPILLILICLCCWSVSRWIGLTRNFNGFESSRTENWIIIGNESFNPQQHCFVSAFFDIGRGSWKSKFTRSVDRYFLYFDRFVAFPEPLVVFMDEQHVDRLVEVVQLSRPNYLTIIIPITENFLVTHIWSWSLLPREREIMNSPAYKAKIAHRISHPEHHNPRYTLINHAKIDFVNYVIEEFPKVFPKRFHPIEGVNRYSWIDFGYLHDISYIPKKNYLHLEMLSPSNITYFIMSEMHEKYADPEFILAHAPDLVTGGFFSGTIPVLEEFQKQYHTALLDHQKMNIANDDQDMIPFIYYKKWDRFTFIQVNSFKHALLYLCDYQAN